MKRALLGILWAALGAVLYLLLVATLGTHAARITLGALIVAAIVAVQVRGFIRGYRGDPPAP